MRAVWMKAGALGQVALLQGALAVTAASAQVPVVLTVSDKTARGVVELPGGLGVELTLSFENVVGLHPGALEVWATLVDPLDPSLLARLPPPEPGLLGLPGPRLVTIPVALPILLRIDPSPSSALGFEGLASLELYTHNLQLDPLVPLALYKSHDGGPFHDIMSSEGRGSYRAGGGGGDFSEFLIVVDLRPIDVVIVEKFGLLQSLLDEHAESLPPTVATSLQQRLTRARAYYDAGATLAAIWEMGAFSRYVEANSGQDIPDVWRAHCGGTNVAGQLRSAADTLKFSLDRKASR
jgi:hypothetical protein